MVRKLFNERNGVRSIYQKKDLAKLDVVHIIPPLCKHVNSAKKNRLSAVLFHAAVLPKNPVVSVRRLPASAAVVFFPTSSA